MKNKLILSLIILFSCNHEEKKDNQRLVVKSSKDTIDYFMNDRHSTWTIMPKMKPDVMEAECGKAGAVIKLMCDSAITFKVNEGDTIDFVILLKDRDSAWTRIIGVPKNVNFTDEYIQQHQGKNEIEIPEVHELVNIMMAISRMGRKDSNMINMETPYYKEVMSRFSKFDKHPAIDTINAHMRENNDNQTYNFYYGLKMGACAYTIDASCNITNTGIIRNIGFGSGRDPISKNKALYEDFARKSNFIEFFSSHKPYYDTLLRIYKELNPIDKMEKWLNKKFGFSYGNYRITFSPLVGGAHSTQKYFDNNFAQTIMFVSAASYYKGRSRSVNEMLESRVVFTEIDHNFVNPVTDRYFEQVDSIFSNRDVWTKKERGTEWYGNPYSVFNEYMTWAVFSLYCMDHFEKKDIDEFEKVMNHQMDEGRGFIKFSAFNDQLMKLYTANRSITMDGLYKEMLKWAKEKAK